MTWRPTSPVDVSQFMSFVARQDDNDSGWHYGDSNASVANQQAEGVAGICTILTKNPVALLADEVGMGKTFQAFGVMTMMWRENPSAKVLVVVPKSHLTGQWEKEYAFFREKMLRSKQELPDPGLKLPKVVEVRNLAELVDARANITDPEPLFLLTRLSIFSNLTRGSEVKSSKTDLARELASELRRNCLPFDFLVLDESHYLRTKEGGSQRVAAVEAFLGRVGTDEPKTLAEKILLMTGTPNHSTNDDVSKVLSYFVSGTDDLLRLGPRELLKTIAIRRLRKLAGKAKYEYRLESDIPCMFPDDDPEAEVYFALYQRGLAHLQNRDAEGQGRSVHKHEQRRFLYGYLEGFESLSVLPESDPQPESATKNDDRELRDYHHADDTDVLRSLAELWNGAPPSHPKYDGSLKELIPSDSYWHNQNRAVETDKTLIFVRRVPSCHEMVTRVNQRYDHLFLRMLLAGAKDVDPSKEIHRLLTLQGTDFRRTLDSILKTVDQIEESADNETDEDVRLEISSKAVPSRVMDYFRTHAKALDPSGRYTVGSRFRKRFEASASPFKNFFSVSSPESEESKDQDADSFLRVYLDSIRGDARQMREWNDLRGWCRSNPQQNQMGSFIGTFLRKGILLASPGVVELFAWFLESERETNHTSTEYAKFCQTVRRRFQGSVCQRLAARAVACYRDFNAKFVSQNDAEIVAHNWNHLNAADPAEFCSGEVTSEGARERLIHAFNSPFFPHILVATSVLQEGVNLHYHCRRVMHYGIAWTPGDNEQRVGRVDRLYGAVERSIAHGKAPTEGHLSILYPFLQNTFDEHQLAQFVDRKMHAEDVLDRGEVLRTDKRIDVSQVGHDWKSKLRKPSAAQATSDPFPFRPSVNPVDISSLSGIAQVHPVLETS